MGHHSCRDDRPGSVAHRWWLTLGVGPSHVWPQRGAQAAISRGRWASSLGLPGRERRAAGLQCISGDRIIMETISATVIRLWPIHPSIESLQQGLATGAGSDS